MHLAWMKLILKLFSCGFIVPKAMLRCDHKYVDRQNAWFKYKPMLRTQFAYKIEMVKECIYCGRIES